MVYFGLVLAVTNLALTILLLWKVGQMASTFGEVKAVLEAVAIGVNSLEDAIADLKRQVAEGHVITQAELDELGSLATAINTDLADPSDQG